MGGIITRPILVLCAGHKTQQAVNPQLDTDFRLYVNYLGVSARPWRTGPPPVRQQQERKSSFRTEKFIASAKFFPTPKFPRLASNLLCRKNDAACG
jgi:hypothetical protein